MNQQEAAEQIRAYLVSLRGGAPFLSPADARLLRVWLDRGASVPRILVELDRAAEKRRARRMRTPLSLQNIKGPVSRQLAEGPAPVRTTGPLTPLVERLRDSSDPRERQAAEELAACADTPAALEVVRRFHETRWVGCRRDLWLEKADEALADLKELVPESRYALLREEAARDLLRQEHPLLSATAVWDTVSP